MKTKFLFLALCLIVTMPCVLQAEEVEIQLMEVIGLNPIPGDNPLDDPIQSPGVPTRPTDFRASINGMSLSVIKRNETIPSVHATVVNASTGAIVVNQEFTTSLLEQVSTSGVYVLHLQTDGGSLVGQFVVQ